MLKRDWKGFGWVGLIYMFAIVISTIPIMNFSAALIMLLLAFYYNRYQYDQLVKRGYKLVDEASKNNVSMWYYDEQRCYVMLKKSIRFFLEILGF